VVQAQGDKNSVLRIDAIFVEDFRHTSHLSNGSVESAEYKDIHDRLDAITVMKTESAEAERQREEKLTQQFASAETARAATPPPPPTPAVESAGNSGSAPQATLAQAAPQTLEERVKDLRRQVQRLVKAPGAPLKSAPFHTASTLQSLPAGIEVLIVISTTYWFGVETHDGQHGWILRDELEQLP
jgi:polyhydroxyalkanoate synthesis regulator phasin